MGAHNDTANDYQLFADGTQSPVPPASGGTFNIGGKDRCTFIVGAGTFKLPDGIPRGVSLSVYATGAATITNAAGTVVQVLAAEQIGCFTAKTSSTWTVSVQAVGGTPASVISIADAGSFTAVTNVEAALQEIFPRVAVDVNTAITTVGAGTLTAAGIVGGVVTRSGSTAAYTDTTATYEQILAAHKSSGSTVESWYLVIKNTVAFAQTVAGGTGVTVSGLSIVPPNSSVVFLVTIAGVDDVTMVGLFSAPQANLPTAQFSTSSTVTSLTAAAGVLTGSRHVIWENTADGAVALTTRTATQMFGDIPNCHIGLSYLLTIANKGDNTVTLTAPGGGGVTLTGTATVATTKSRTWVATFTSATAITFQAISVADIET